MSGRAVRVLLSVVLLLAVIVIPASLLPSVRASPPAVTLQATNKGTQTCTGSTCSFGVVVAAGASTLLTMYLATGGGNNINVSAASCNSQPLTLLANFTTGVFGGIPTDFSHVYVFYGVGFAAGSLVCGGNIVGPGPGGTIVLWVDQVWSNVLQSAPISQHGQATGTTQTTMSVTLSTVPASTHIIADFVTTCCQLHIPTAGVGQTEQWAQFYAGINYAKGSTKPGGSSATMSWTVSLANDAWALYAIDIAAVPPIIDTFTVSTTGLTATFASIVSGGAGGPYNTTWAFGDGGVSYSANPSHAYASRGTYTVYLNVTDAGSNTASATGSATVSTGSSSTTSPPPPTLPPNVVQYPQITNLNCNQVVFTDPRSSAAISSTILWVYDFGDGSPLDYSPVPTVNHTYAMGRLYTASMTVQDKQGNVQSYSMSVDTSALGCGITAVRVLGPTVLAGLFVASLVVALVIPKKSRFGKYKKHILKVAGASLFIAILIVVVL